MTAEAPERTSILRLAAGSAHREQLERDVVQGLTADPKWLPPKYFYDARGSELFEDITELPEYYQTRTETSILDRVMPELIRQTAPAEVVEIGSGSSRKTRLLLEAMHQLGCGDLYVPFDVSSDALVAAAAALTQDYPWLRVDGVVGDFEQHLEAIPRKGRALVVFLGSTIGNLNFDAQPHFLSSVARSLRPADAFLLGVDLVKDAATLEAAYDDAAGVTAAFNRNVLTVLNRELNADFDTDAFTHVARYDVAESRIEILLRADREMVVTFPTLDLRVSFAAGEEMQTEISCKYTREVVEGLLSGAGLRLTRWDTDERDRFAVALAVPG
jgi:L-histidine N-alpha-methyltransferase